MSNYSFTSHWGFKGILFILFKEQIKVIFKEPLKKVCYVVENDNHNKYEHFWKSLQTHDFWRIPTHRVKLHSSFRSRMHHRRIPQQLPPRPVPHPKIMNRKRPGQSLLTTRDQKDIVSCVSGTSNGRTLGSPLCF